MTVRRYDYTAQFAGILSPIMEQIEQILLSGNYVLGEHVEKFEETFSKYIGTKYCIGVNSGTDALILALEACQIGVGNRVAVQANTFYATVAAILHVGAVPVLIDVDPNTLLLDLDALERETELDAIIPVHLYGLSSDLTRILRHAARIGAIVIEDCAQAVGAFHMERRAGSFGLVGCFSFHPSKNLAAAGDAGACVTSDTSIAERLKVLRHLGQRSQNEHVALGRNTKLDAIQAVVLSAKLPLLDAWNARRVEVATRYRGEIANLPLACQHAGENGAHVYHLFQLRSPKRDALLLHLLRCGIEATVRYPTPIHLQPAFQHYEWARGSFPIAEALAKELLCLPIRPNMPNKEVSTVSEAVQQFFSRRNLGKHDLSSAGSFDGGAM